MHYPSSRFRVVLSFAIAVSIIVPFSLALAQQDYPNKPITMVVPFNAEEPSTLRSESSVRKRKKTWARKFSSSTRPAGGDRRAGVRGTV